MNYSQLKDALITVLEQGDSIHNQRSAMIDVLQSVNECLIQPMTSATVADGDEGALDKDQTELYYLLNDMQKELYGRITMELDEYKGLSLDQLKEVYAALIQGTDVIDFN